MSMPDLDTPSAFLTAPPPLKPVVIEVEEALARHIE